MGQNHKLTFRMLTGSYAIVRLNADAAVPEWATKGEFSSITRTADELSIVCLAGNLPDDVNTQHHWTCLKLEGPFPFSMTGVLLSFIEPLSSNQIPIFAMSTYDTDYVLIPEEYSESAIEILTASGHALLS